MNRFTLTLLLASIGLPQPQPEPWPRVTVEGVVKSDEPFALFAWDDKRLSLEWQNGTHIDRSSLGFAAKADYLTAERLIDQGVRIEAYKISRGSETWLVPVTMQRRE